MMVNESGSTSGSTDKRLLIAFLLILVLTGPLPVPAAGETAACPTAGQETIAVGEISWFLLVVGLLGGLALFLYGLEKMSEGLKKTAGRQLRDILAALTSNRVIGFLVGAFVTMVIQSSSATTVMLVSFVQAELMTFARALGVILGADVGTTITAQVIAFDFSQSALLLVALGFAIRMFANRRQVRNIGDILLGFGILFYGMKLMSDSMSPLRSCPEIISLMQGLEAPAFGLLAGMVLTALIQSSSAFTGIVIVLSQQGLITLEAGIPMVLGANIGTCITAAFASIGMSRNAKRVALAHILFKVIGVLLFIFWIPYFADLIRYLSGFMNADTGREIANAHTIFNVGMGVLFLPFTPLFAALIIKILPDRKGWIMTREPTTWYLDERRVDTPEIAINLARTEVSRMAKLLERMLRAIIIPFISDERYIAGSVSKAEADLYKREIPKNDEIFPELTLLEGIHMREEKIDFLEEKIMDYLNQVLRHDLDEQSVNEIYGMMSIAKDMESIGDIIHRNLVPLIEKKQALHADFSDEGKEELMIYHQKACNHIRLLKEAFAETAPGRACSIMDKERIYLDLESQYRIKHLSRIQQQQKESVVTHEVHMELLDMLKQIIVYSSNIALTFSGICRDVPPSQR
ncbi:MAG: Na/Pi cotransporter family protein [Desulfosudaceae bacterium]